MSDQRRISREQVLENLQRRSGGREVGYLRHVERLTAVGWEPRDAGRYAELFHLWLESQSSASARLHAKELADARALEKKYGVGSDFAVLKEPPAQR